MNEWASLESEYPSLEVRLGGRFPEISESWTGSGKRHRAYGKYVCMYLHLYVSCHVLFSRYVCMCGIPDTARHSSEAALYSAVEIHAE